MLESLFITIIAIAFVLFILGIENSSKVYLFMSMILWIIIFAQSLYIEVPSDTSYTEYGLNAVSLIFIFANLIFYLALQFDWRNRYF